MENFKLIALLILTSFIGAIPQQSWAQCAGTEQMFCYSQFSSNEVGIVFTPSAGMIAQSTITDGTVSFLTLPSGVANTLTVYESLSPTGATGTVVYGPIGTLDFMDVVITASAPDLSLKFVFNATPGIFGCQEGFDDQVVVCSESLPATTVTFPNPAAVCDNAGSVVRGGGLPAGGTYSGNGVIDNANGFDFTFNPTGTGVVIGNNPVTYTNGGSATANITVSAAPSVTFTAPAALCIDAGLQSNLGGGSPSGGTYAGPGVTMNGNGTYNFNPAIAGLGVKTITYTVTDGACTVSATGTVDVQAACGCPGGQTNHFYCGGGFATDVVAFEVCPSPGMAAKATITGGTFDGNFGNTLRVYEGATGTGSGGTLVFGPMSGNLAGTMISGNGADQCLIFVVNNPSSLSCQDGTETPLSACGESIAPSVSFTAPDDLCIDAGVQMNLSGGSPSGGTYTGPGVSLNTDGTFNFDPAIAGVGTHTITYTVAGQGSASDDVEVFATGTAGCLSFTAPADLCIDAAAVPLDGGSPTGGTYSGSGVVDNMDGTFSFDPSMAGVAGTKTITYTTNVGSVSDDIEVFALPIVMFTAPGDLCFSQPPALYSNLGTPSGGVYGGPGVGNVGDGVNFTFNPSAAGVGVKTLTYTLTQNGCSATASDNIEVIADDALTITCPGTQIGTVDANCNFSVPDYTGLATVEDNCTPFSITQSPSAGMTFNGTGNTPITLTVTDNNNVTADCSFTLSLEDNIAPTAVCQNVTIEVGAVLTAAQVNGGSSDNCAGSLDLSVAPNTFGCSNIGPNQVTLTVTDDSGLSATCTSNVTVEDNVMPTITSCPVNRVVLTSNNGGYDCNSAIPDMQSEIIASDNCGIVSISQSPPPGSNFTGLNGDQVLVTFTVVDASGNENFCFATLTLKDDELPTVACGGSIPPVSADMNCMTTVSDIRTSPLVTSSDNCGAPALSQSPSPGTMVGVGTTLITITATDDAGLTATCTYDLVVEDNAPPVALCKDVTVLIDASGSTTLTANDIDNGSFDNCGIAASNINGFASVTLFCNNVGQANMVQLNLTDVNGNTSSCTSNVTVESILPVANCTSNTITLPLEEAFLPDGITPNPNAGLATISIADIDDGSTLGSCGPTTLSLDRSIFSCIDAEGTGIVPVTLTVTDANGDSDQCTVDISVIDNTPPVFTLCPTDIIVGNDAGECSADVSFATPLAVDNCAIETGSQDTNAPNDDDNEGLMFDVTNTTGETIRLQQIRVRHEQSGNTYNTAVYQRAGGNGASLNAGEWTLVAQEGPYTSTSERAISFLPGIELSAGETVGLYVANIAPNLNDYLMGSQLSYSNGQIILDSPQEVQVDNNTDPFDPSVGFDSPKMFDGVLVYSITTGGSELTGGLSSGSTFPVGTTMQQFTATDIFGNSNTCDFTVTVNDVEPPSIDFFEDNIMLACSASTNPADLGPIITSDNCAAPDEIMLSFLDQTSGALCDGQTILRTITATDPSGNPSTAVQTLLIAPPVAPTISCPDLMIVECFSDINPSADNAIVTTECTDGLVTVSTPMLTSGTADCNGAVYTVTYTVTDGCGQTASCTQDFAIVNDGPTIACAADETVECVEDINPTEADVAVMTSCDVDSDIDISEATIFGQDGCSGTVYQFTYTVTDVCGREASCTRSYTLENEGPEIMAPAAETVECATDINVDAEDAEVEYACALDGDVVISGPVQVGDDDCPGTTYTYTYTVTDECGRSASDEQIFTIQNAGPTIASPADQTVECASDIATDANAAVVTTSCTLGSSVVISGPVRVGPENCPGTTYTYTYIVTDDCGRMASNDQVFTIGENDGPTIAVVPSITVDCFESINPNPNLADVTTACGNGVDFSVAVTDPVLGSGLNCPGEMYSVTYTITDACGRTASALQTYTIDNEGPTMECPDNCEVLSCYDGDYNHVIDAWLLTVTASSSCSMDLTVSNNYLGLEGICVGDFTPVTFTATDACGRTASCESGIFIVDTAAPDIIGEPSELLVPCTGVTEDIFADWLATRGGVEAYDACYEDDITWSTNPANPMALLDCSNGPQAIVVEFIVTDGCGNSASVTGVFNTKLLPNMVNVSGLIQTEEAEPVADVQVGMYSASSGIPNMDISTSDGNYAFPEVEYEENITIEPQKTDGLLNGVSTFDLILLQQHILDIAPLNSPYKRIAADINRSGTISTLDLVLLRRAILLIDEEFMDNTSWRFVDADFVFPNPTNPFETDFPEAYNLSGEEEELADFVAVKIGDLNLDAETNSFGNQSDDRSGLEELIFEVEDQQLKAGATYEVEVNAQNFNAIRGFQMTLDYDQSLVDVLDIEQGALPEFSSANYNLAFTKVGQLPISWNDQLARDLSFGDAAFRIIIKAKADIQLSEVLSISSSLTKAEAYNATELMNVSLNFSNNSTSLTTDKFELFQNTPNPFKDVTTIGFQLPEAGEVTLEIYDVTGKLLHVERGDFAAGYNQFDLDRANLQTGILYYQVSTARDSNSKKMILMD